MRPPCASFTCSISSRETLDITERQWLGILAYTPRFTAILQEARREIAETGGIPHDEFWHQVDAEYEAGENVHVPGLHAGQAQMSDDFDQLLPDEFWNGAP